MPVVNDDGVFETELEAAIPTLPSELKVEWDKMNQPFGEVKSTSKEDTPVVAKTASPLVTITEGDVGEAINVGMGAGPAMIAGSASKTANIPARIKAAMDLNKGTDSKEVLQQTGWFKGTDGRMKYEISDEGMKLADRDWKFGETGKLSEFVEHPELFKAYPDLKDINFKVAEKDYKYIGSYNDASKTLTINPQAVRAGDEGLLDVLTHEIQHIVQSKEGFATGSNPTKALEDALEALKTAITGRPYDAEKEKALSLYLDMKAKAKDFGEYMYLRAPGEVEANMAAARRKLSDEMRKEFPVQEHQKLVEGEINTLHGGKYLPEFNYPKPSKGSAESAIAKLDDIPAFKKEWFDETVPIPSGGIKKIGLSKDDYYDYYIGRGVEGIKSAGPPWTLQDRTGDFINQIAISQKDAGRILGLMKEGKIAEVKKLIAEHENVSGQILEDTVRTARTGRDSAKDIADKYFK